MLADRLAAVGEMAAGVAHELRNPLTSVKLLMQTATDGHGGVGLTEEHIHVVVEQVARMENTIQRLLDFARPPQMKQVRQDIRETLQRALNLAEGYASQQSVSVERDCPPEPVIVNGDPEQLHQVFVNLVMNAVEAMPDGGVLRIDDAACGDAGTALSHSVLRYRRRHRRGDHAAHLRTVRYGQRARHGSGAGHLPADCGAARRQAHCRQSAAAGCRLHARIAAFSGTLYAVGGSRESGAMPTLLVIDDESSIRISIKAVFNRSEVTVLGAETAEEGIRLAAEHSPAVILLDIKLGAASGLEVFYELRRVVPRCLIVFITGFGTAETAIEAMKLGAYDYLTKPLDATQLRRVVEQALAISQLVSVPTIIDEGDRPEDKPDRLVGSGSAIMQAVCKQVGRTAPQDVNVLVLGESGTGKELVARALFHHSRRSQQPFLAINCAAIAGIALGERAVRPRARRVHRRGTSPHRQVRTMRSRHALSRRSGRYGSAHAGQDIEAACKKAASSASAANESISVDVRIIAATNQDLPALIEQGRFRKDLYYRLSGVTISLPPLQAAAGGHRRAGPLLPLPL